MTMAGFGGFRKAGRKPKTTSVTTRVVTALAVEGLRKIRRWPVICNAVLAAMNGLIQIMSKPKNALTHRRIAGMQN